MFTQSATRSPAASLRQAAPAAASGRPMRATRRLPALPRVCPSDRRRHVAEPPAPPQLHRLRWGRRATGRVSLVAAHAVLRPRAMGVVGRAPRAARGLHLQPAARAPAPELARPRIARPHAAVDDRRSSPRRGIAGDRAPEAQAAGRGLNGRAAHNGAAVDPTRMHTSSCRPGRARSARPWTSRAFAGRGCPRRCRRGSGSRAVVGTAPLLAGLARELRGPGGRRGRPFSRR